MAINRASIAKELLPGLNAIFGIEYGSVDDEHAPLFETENSDRAFEEEVLFTGFGTAPTKGEGGYIKFHNNYNIKNGRGSRKPVSRCYVAWSAPDQCLKV